MAVERQRPRALTAGLQVTGRHPRCNLQPGLTPGLRADSPAMMAGLGLTGRQGQFHPKSSKNPTSSAAAAAIASRPRGAALKSGGSAQNESKFSVISSRRQPSGRRDGFRLTPLRMCSCGMGLARACLLVLPWSVCLGRLAESRARPRRAHSAVETAIPVALVADFRALQVASNGLGASARS